MTPLQDRFASYLTGITPEQEEVVAATLYGEDMPEQLQDTVIPIALAALKFVATAEDAHTQIGRMVAVVARMIAVGYSFREQEYLRMLREEVIS
jgi:hypothetical protein